MSVALPRVYIPVLLFCLLSLSSLGQHHSIDSLIRIIQLEKDSNKIKPLLQEIVQVRDRDSSMTYWKEALSLSETMNYGYGQLQSLYKIAELHRLQDQPTVALEYLERAIPIARKMRQIKFEYEIYRKQAKCLRGMGHTEEGLQRLAHALEIADNLEDLNLQAEVLFELGEFYRLQDNFDQAIIHYEKAMNFYHENNLEKGYCRLLFYTAMTYKHFDAVEKKKKGIDLLEEVTYGTCGEGMSTRSKAINLSNLGSAYVDIGNLEKGEEVLMEALVLKKEVSNANSLAYTLNELSSLYLEKKEYSKALEFAEEALVNSQEGTDVFLMENIYASLAKSNYKTNNYKRGYDFLYALKSLKDSLHSEKSSQALSDMVAKYDLKKKENSLMQKDLLIAEQNGRFNRYLLIGLLILSFILGLFFLSRWKFQKQKIEAQKLKELDELKSNFFTNITHELRTPLTVIMNSFSNRKVENGQVQLSEKEANIVERNTFRLHDLINQLLDLSKLEAGKMKLQVYQNDLSKVLKNLVHTFDALAVQKNIKLQFVSHQSPLIAYFDLNKLERMVLNLLSNAIKFTQEGGMIDIVLFAKDGYAEIMVKDNGTGISEEALPYVFDRFHQEDNTSTKSFQGTGIGLALVQQMAKIHRGSIKVESVLGQGTTFFLQIPLERSSYLSEQIVDKPKLKQRGLNFPLLRMDTITKEEDPITNIHAPLVLLVEDDSDLRFLLKAQLHTKYRVLEATDGVEGTELAFTHIPDLIVSDVMMPKRNGYELCSILKKDTRTSHIPIILLTAKSTQAEKVEGLAFGADSYLIKPYDQAELAIRINNLIAQRNQLKERFANDIIYKTKSSPVNSREDLFIQQVLTIIEEHHADEKFGVEELAQAIHMSRSQLYRKLKALTDKTPTTFLKELRLNRAKDLLEQGAGNVSEVAIMVGFSNANYFYKCFKKAYGKTPGEVLNS